MNTIGHNFRLTTFGESHAIAMGGIIDGCPSKLLLDIDKINAELARRQGNSIHTTARQEPNEVEFLSGVLKGVTLGTPIAFMVRNKDCRPQDYDAMKELYRPNHGDYTWQEKYGIRDARGGGRASARETVSWVVAGAIAKQILAQSEIEISAKIESIGGERNYKEIIEKAQQEKDTLGGIISCRITHLKVGLGEPVFDKITSRMAQAMMSIPSAMGFEMGKGFEAATMRGSEYIDPWNNDFSTQTNHCGGAQGGISNGMPLEFRVAFHPVVTIPKGINCNDAIGNQHWIEPKGRHDSCHVLRVPAIVEALAAMVILDFELEK